jgi:hypothetical protein
MLVYNPFDVENYFLNQQLNLLVDENFIPQKQEVFNIEHQTKLNSNENILLRSGFILLGMFLFSSIFGVIGLVLLSGSNGHAGWYIVLFAQFFACLFGVELLARQNYYSHGLLDVAILYSIGILAAAFAYLFEADLPVYLVMLVAGTAAGIRYLHPPAVLVACFGLVLLIFKVINSYLDLAVVMPFVGLLLAVALYFGYLKLSENIKYYYHKYNFQILKIFSLFLAYFSMNYLVVRQLSEELLGLELKTGTDIPFAIIFYAFTFLSPIFYIYYSLKKHDRTFMYIGFFCIAFSFFTIRFYHSLLPIEIALTLGGVVLFSIAFVAMKLFKKKTENITFEADRNNKESMFLNAQSLIVNSAINVQPVGTNSDMEFGGGQFSGGGAGENF